MKHKAQESLDTLECRVYTADDEICEINLRLGRCSRCDFKGALKDVQDLIDCQLTVEELDELLLTLGLKIHDMDYLQIRNDRFYLLNNIIEKVKKQKEMWVSENE